ncbi:precorrin-6y C5,15-methyltransferase (decarboxylating) subunit CbiE [Pseudobacteriovorax antillogorgiicola]|uniref:tRNA (guanine(46)-N(7))-methyltransferase n=1 Tax=Pseudobacteriovorax antillogorgiicola TaxID=1513793 RepID=A0A1Y6C140_9BACT|nr:precorrin-6y C5,15-methyltransferase (decarboxylating) subunit CbiE [Pseudobacteriovorax antillogorgiicola]TCS50675.1 precorrin-6Y C5,15-methyltransferase (decarboxylating) [Pseudobacteriovorax antillogorgiicola]SMF40057.1 precorrin-6Y C5,15-methyltransferase (decarboxylating) [Pseudobacteriovorax antillogorgiicola]
MAKFKAIRLIGIGDDGCLSLSSRAYNASIDCQILVGGERQLAFFPDHPARKIVIKKNLKQLASDIDEMSHEYNIGILASGDPLFFGIGTLLIKRIGIENIDIIPSPSSVQLAFAKIGKPWQDCRFLSVHGRPLDGFVNKVQSHRKVAVLTDQDRSPQQIARRLIDYKDEAWAFWVCENLGGVDEKVTHFDHTRALEIHPSFSPLNVLIMERPPSWQPRPGISFQSEEAFSKRMPRKGLITKSEVRLLTLAKLQIQQADVVWDIGAGSGSVAIEAAKCCPEGFVYAVECDPQGIPFCQENIFSHQVDNVHLLEDRAPECFEKLPDPDAIFVGGSKGSLQQIISKGMERLKPQGRLLVNAVTLDNVAEARQAFQQLGILPEMVMIQVSRGVPLAGKYLKYEALNPIHMFSVTKGES